MVYQWRYFNFPVDANEVGRIIEEIEEEHGTVTAKLLLDRARDEKSEIHQLFEWDNDKAAEKYRLEQATRIITAVAVVIDEDVEEPKTVRAFANVGTRKEGQFMQTVRALSNEETRKIVLQHALEELKAFQSKYKDLDELSIIFADIDALQEVS